MKNLQASCMTKVQDGMVVNTYSNRVNKARKVLYELMLSDHSQDCLSCTRNQTCKFQALGKQLGVDVSRFEGERSSYRMDAYAPAMLDLGLKGMIGKGRRSKAVVDSMIKNGAVYFAAIGGAAAIISRSVKKADVVAYEDLGTEAIRRLEVEDFPCIVVTDCEGNDLYVTGPEKYKR
jgi:hypothetical protein